MHADPNLVCYNLLTLVTISLTIDTCRDLVNYKFAYLSLTLNASNVGLLPSKLVSHKTITVEVKKIINPNFGIANI